MVDPPVRTLSECTPIVPAERVTIAEDFARAVRRLGAGGIPILALHGFPCTSLIWVKGMHPLAEACFDVVALDLRGYGESDYAPDEVACLPDSVARPDLTGPFIVPDSGHFMQWEQPATVVSALRGFLGHPENRR